MILDPYNRPTLGDILGTQYPTDGFAYRNESDNSLVYSTEELDLEDESFASLVPMERESFLSEVSIDDPIVNAVFQEWDIRFGDGPKPSPMNEIPNDPLLGVKIAVPAYPKA